jgi:hypothetical protein
MRYEQSEFVGHKPESAQMFVAVHSGNVPVNPLAESQLQVLVKEVKSKLQVAILPQPPFEARHGLVGTHEQVSRPNAPLMRVAVAEVHEPDHATVLGPSALSQQ